MLNGAHLKFDEESQALYDAVAPSFPEAHFQEILASLSRNFPVTDRSCSVTRSGGKRL